VRSKPTAVIEILENSTNRLSGGSGLCTHLERAMKRKSQKSSPLRPQRYHRKGKKKIKYSREDHSSRRDKSQRTAPRIRGVGTFSKTEGMIRCKLSGSLFGGRTRNNYRGDEVRKTKVLCPSFFGGEQLWWRSGLPFGSEERRGRQAYQPSVQKRDVLSAISQSEGRVAESGSTTAIDMQSGCEIEGKKRECPGGAEISKASRPRIRHLHIACQKGGT